MSLFVNTCRIEGYSLLVVFSTPKLDHMDSINIRWAVDQQIGYFSDWHILAVLYLALAVSSMYIQGNSQKGMMLISLWNFRMLANSISFRRTEAGRIFPAVG
jgi:hypothetical protein